MSKKSNKDKLPKPNAAFRTNDQEGEFTAAEILGMVCNPIYAGMGPFPQLIPDEKWVAAAKQAIKKEGKEQFLVNMLYLLRLSLAGEMDDTVAD
jgi:hypothetical protein